MNIIEYIHLNNNYKILIGKNQFNNWQILDESNSNDILFHVSDSSSSYVILKNNENKKKKDFPKQVIRATRIFNAELIAKIILIYLLNIIINLYSFTNIMFFPPNTNSNGRGNRRRK